MAEYDERESGICASTGFRNLGRIHASWVVSSRPYSKTFRRRGYQGACSSKPMRCIHLCPYATDTQRSASCLPMVSYSARSAFLAQPMRTFHHCNYAGASPESTRLPVLEFVKSACTVCNTALPLGRSAHRSNTALYSNFSAHGQPNDRYQRLERGHSVWVSKSRG